MASYRTPLRHLALLSIVALLATLALAATALEARAATLTFTPNHDATVQESRPTTNYGSGQTLEVDASSRKDSLLTFQVTGVGSATVTRATLRLYAVDSSDNGGDVAKVNSPSWNESSITWQNAPAGVPPVAPVGGVSAGSWYEVDVTAHVTGDGAAGFRISTPSSNGADYAAKEHSSGNGPQLVVETGGPSTPDGEAPSTPGNLTASSVAPRSVGLSWSPSSDNVGVAGYNVYRGGTLLAASGAATSYTDTTVQPQTAYRYTVRARDAAGNLSGASNALDVTTPADSGGGSADYTVSHVSGSTYRAVSSSRTFTGSVKSVVESAMYQLNSAGGGTIRFTAGTFDLGDDHLEITDVTDVTFVGAGMGVTVLRNDTNRATDTEVFDATRSDRLTIRDLSVDAGGSARNTSDALDFDGGDDILIERVEVRRARGRGILFDGKDLASSTGGTALRNVIRDCVITSGVPQDGIQFLASSQGIVEGCRISGVGGDGIRANKSSTSAGQPNKPSNDNVFRNNTITGVGGSAISVHSGNRNTINGNTLRDNGRDGVRIFTSVSGLSCNDNVVRSNTASGNRYGLSIDNRECARTVVGTNSFSGNSSGAVNDNGTGTIYSSGGADTEAPTTPGNLTASAQPGVVNLAWNAATDNVAVTGYDVYRGGSLLASSVSGTTYSDTTVAPSTAYAYTVRARDAAGNTSGASNTANVTTPGGGGGGGGGTLTFTPSHDATVQESRATTNYGSGQTLEVDASSRKDSLLTFQVTGVGSATVTRATLRLYAVDSSDNGGDVAKVTGPSWNESSITWQNAPEGVPPVAPVGGVSAGSWYEVDVTAHVTGDGAAGFRISSPSSNGADYAAKEHSSGNRPQLVIQTTP